MSENLQIVIGADIQDLTKGLQQAQKATDQFSNNIKKSVTNANFALTNLNRLAQDAPFGFIAIQNNITPLLDSFTQLRIETGSTGGAFKALAASLVGPAGIAFGVSLLVSGITTLIQKYGSLSNAAEALFIGNGKLIQRQQELIKFQNDLSNSVSGEVSKVFILIEAYKAWEGQTAKQDVVLKKLSESSDIFKKAIDGQIVSYDSLVKANEAYLKSLLGRIVIETQQEQIRQLAKDYVGELVKLQQQEERNAKAAAKKRDAAKSELELITRLGQAQSKLNGDIITAQPKVNRTLLTTQEATQKLIDKFLQAAGSITSGSGRIISQLGLVDLGIKTVNNNKPIEIFAPLKGELQTVERTNTAFKDYINTLSIIPKKLADKKITEGVQIYRSEKVQQDVRNLDLIKEKSLSYLNTISPVIDNIFSALQSGQNVFKSIGEGIKQMVLEIIKGLVKMAALAVIIQIISSATGTPMNFGSALKIASGITPGLKNASAPSIGGMGGMTGGMQLAGNVVFVQRGYDLVGVLNAANGSINNVG